jgi:hypothetical protein
VRKLGLDDEAVLELMAVVDLFRGHPGRTDAGGADPPNRATALARFLPQSFAAGLPGTVPRQDYLAPYRPYRTGEAPYPGTVQSGS